MFIDIIVLPCYSYCSSTVRRNNQPNRAEEIEMYIHTNHDEDAFREFMRNPHLIPEEWHDKGVFFWGTLREGYRGLYVCYLHYDAHLGRWRRGGDWLEYLVNCAGSGPG
jgi:hypothetical protein